MASEIAPDVEVRHLVDPSLLSCARDDGLTPALVERVRSQLRSLADSGAGLIVCTCSTIGGIAEEAAAEIGVPVIRADRPMAEAAVAAGSRIAVIVTTPSTLDPTLALFPPSVTVVPVVVSEAWRHFEAGDLPAYYEEIAEAARKVAPSVDVVVLAQASMAPAADLIDGEVLTSPRSAVTAAAALLRLGGFTQ
ncbi:aspartate/glutamate racemase family protein [Actinoplanes sp. NPDC051861]|uniref:aspartate/glutamate racemase family protein n=1 Tax=Actinoplanes sp. NPDC051861 TaxID=3155170 RepID=UPI00341AA08D